eukprot:TRINITY_DN4367_c0_g1_i1.p1 TRINITY_DN4367_c0_g1~~TRINITY_DN4367_c0_g1_i1.p1  ORF type:complete len:1457 (+),score=324.91 TRINITY_DN4367_c0_g1_i1:89-4372(+)
MAPPQAAADGTEVASPQKTGGASRRDGSSASPKRASGKPKAPPSAEAAARALFEQMDKNEDGRISHVELKKKLASGDGEIHRILGLKDAKTRSQLSYRLWEARKKLDLDGDGNISLEDLIQLFSQAATDTPDSRPNSRANSHSRPNSRASNSRGGGGEGNSRSKARLDDFLDRHCGGEPSPQNKIRREVSVLARELVKHGKDDDDKGLLGAQGVEGFVKMLKQRYGSVAAAWRIGLDRDANGKVSFGELLQSCRELGFTGNVRKLWMELDVDKGGFISLSELDAEAAKDLEDFKILCFEQFGNTLSAWQQGINPENAPGVPEKQFAARCKEIGFQGDGRRLFKLLRTDRGRKELTLADFDPQTAAALFRADPCTESISFGGGRKVNSPPMPKAPLTPLILSRSKSLPNKKASGSLGTSPTMSPKHGSESSQIDDSFGASLGAWSVTSAPATPSRRAFAAKRQASTPQMLDLDSPGNDDPAMLSTTSSFGRGKVSTPLSSTTSRWGELATPTRNSGFIRDVSQVQVLDMRLRKEDQIEAEMGPRSKEEVLKQLMMQFGSLRKAWFEVLDPFNSGKIGFQEFCDRLRSVGFLGDIKLLWKALGAEKEGVLRLSDLDAKADKLMKDFKSHLIEKYGNLLNAWQKGFDPKGKTMINEKAFVDQCVKDECPGDHSQVFRLMRENHSAKFITLREFDLAASQALARDDHDMMIAAEHAMAKPSPLELSFYERQARTFSNRWSRAQSLVARSVLAATEKEDQDANKGCDSLESLKAALNKKYGNLAVAWRVALDPTGLGHCSFEDFCVALRNRIGYCGDLNLIWQKLKKPGASYVSLNDLDPASAEILWSFRAVLLDRFGNLMNAWHMGLDPKGRGKLEEHDFISRAKEVGYEGDCEKLFRVLLAEPHKKYIVLRDIDPAASQAYFRYDNKSLTLYGSQSGPSASPRHWTGNSLPSTPADEQPSSSTSPDSPSCSRGLSSPAGSRFGGESSLPVHRPTRITTWSEELGLRKRREAEQRAHEEISAQLGAKCLSDYRKLLVGRFGSLVAAWRYEVDPDCTGRLTYVQFMMAVERVGGYTGSLIRLWNEFTSVKKRDEESTLDRSSSSKLPPESVSRMEEVTMQDLDPDGYGLLQTLCNAIVSKFPTLRDFWSKLDEGHEEQLHEETFVEQCLALGIEGLSQRQLQRVFKLLMPVPVVGRNKLLVEEDLRALLLTVPSPDRRKTWDVPASPTNNSSAAGEEPSSPSKDAEWAMMSPRQRLAKLSPELPVVAVEDFRRMLKRLFGSVYAGWVKYLDVTEVGRVPMGEFVNRARAIGVSGKVAELFAAIDVDMKGFITLQDLDPEVSKEVKAFFRSAEAKYKTIEEAWKMAFNVSKRRVVILEDFVRGCKTIGYEGDAAKLFATMRPEPGRPFLTDDDFGRYASKSVKAHEDELRFQA